MKIACQLAHQFHHKSAVSKRSQNQFTIVQADVFLIYLLYNTVHIILFIKEIAQTLYSWLKSNR